MTSVRLTRIILRIFALVQMLTFAVVLAPTAWIGSWHAWLGFGAMPNNPVLLYVIRGAAFAQVGVGVLLWVIATDVVRYRPLVITIAAICLFAAPTYYFIDTTTGMPRFWCILDFAYCLLAGGGLTVCLLSSRGQFSQTVPPAA
jgi:hypothetical protein